MRPARPAEFLNAPEDRYVVGHCWLTFCVRDSVTGFVIWGAPRAEDANAAVELTPLHGSSLARRRPRLFDVRRIETIAQPALTTLAMHLARNAARLGELVERAAVVHDGGLGLALASGFASLSSMPYDVSLFPDPVAALGWLGCKTPARIASELDALHAEALGTTSLVRELRAHLATSLRTAALPTAAQALGMSVRSLQRKLHEQGTAFQTELDVVRIDVAKRLLADPDMQVAAIARDVGCASPQHFGNLFRRATGVTPRRWRTGADCTDRSKVRSALHADR